MNKDIVVLIPVYDPDEKIMDNFLKELTSTFKNIVFVNDGSNFKHDKYFNKLEKKYPVIKHHLNYGKGRALKNGLNYILNEYKDSKTIVCADCDGQHSVKDILACANVSLKNKDSLVLGCRNFKNSNVPFKSRYGNILTKNILAFFTGINISDTQTGLRAMSYEVAKKFLDTDGERYEYETKVLIETKKKNVNIKEKVIDTIYINDNKTSHFNPLKDSLRIYKLFTKFIIVTLLSYIIECLIFSLSTNIDVLLSIFISKVVSLFIIELFNKYIDVKYTLIDYLILIIIGSRNIFLKIGIDFITFIIYILFKRGKENV